jgi:hypothetical protein
LQRLANCLQRSFSMECPSGFAILHSLFAHA